MGALELLEGFVEVLGEGMLGRVLGEVVVCVAASFERRALWLRERRGRERREERREERERDGRITSYFTQREEVVLCVYGVDQREMEESSGSVDSLSSMRSSMRSNVKSNIKSNTQSNTKSTTQSTMQSNTKSTMQSNTKSTTKSKTESDTKSITVTKSQSTTKPTTKPLSPSTPPEPNLFPGFETDTTLSENLSFSGSLSSAATFFAATLRRIAARHPATFPSLLHSRPYLFLLRFGDHSIADMLQISPPCSLSQPAKSAEELAAFMRTLVATPELSLEVVPAVGYLALLLRTSQRVYQRWLAQQPLLPDVVQQCFLFCLRLASFFVASGNQYAQRLLGEVLGLMGAAAPERFAALAREDGVQPQLGEFDLARGMIRRFFVKDLMGLPRSEIQNRIAFTVQSLLRFLQARMETEPLERLTSDRELLLRAREERRKEVANQSVHQSINQSVDQTTKQSNINPSSTNPSSTNPSSTKQSNINPTTNPSSINPTTNPSNINPTTNPSSINPTNPSNINPTTNPSSINPTTNPSNINPTTNPSPTDSLPTEEDSLPPSLRILFTPEELSVISQYWSTEYSLRSDKQRAERSRGFEGISCKNYAKWVTKLAMRLLLLSPAESSSLSRTDTRSVDSHLSDASSSSVPLSHSSSTLQPSESVLYVFKSLLYPTCADKAAYLLPYFIVFALEYHYKKQRTEENEHASTPRLVIPVGDVPLFRLLATFLNQTLAACDVLSDNETKHCGSEVLATLNTLQAWQLQSQQGIQTNPGQQAIKGLQSMQSNQNNPSNDAAKDQAWRGEMLRGFLGMIDRTQVVRVAKLLGQFEYALR